MCVCIAGAIQIFKSGQPTQKFEFWVGLKLQFYTLLQASVPSHILVS